MPNSFNKIHLVKFKFKRADGSLSGDFNILGSGNLPIATHKNIGFWSTKTREKLIELIKMMEEDVTKIVFEGNVESIDEKDAIEMPQPVDREHIEWEVERDIAEQF